MKVDEMIAVLQAYKEGKTIEISRTRKDNWEKLIGNPSWNFSEYDYSIKPEPHYRPFKNAEEVMEAIKEHDCFLRTEYNIYYALTLFYYEGDSGFFFTPTHNSRSQDDMLADFTFADGTPFGVLED